MELSDFRFSRRDVRIFTQWGDTQLRVHLQRLEELEYLAAHRGGRGQSFVYELLYTASGTDGKPLLPGLIDVAKLRAHSYDGKNAGVNGHHAGQIGKNAAPTRPQNGGIAGGARGASDPITTGLPDAFPAVSAKTHVNGAAENHGPVVAAAQS
jgi:hypothetical protein